MLDIVNRITAPEPVTHNTLILVRGEERYVFVYDDKRRLDAMRAMGRFAANPDLSFNWYDAAVLTERMRGNQ